MRDSKKEFENIKELIAKGSYDEVKPLLKQYLSENTENAEAYKLYGNIFAYTGFLAKARLIWRGALKKFPENTDFMYNLALSNYLQKRPARSYLKNILKISPNDTGAMSMLAQIAKDDGRYDVAIFYWKKILKIEAENVEVMNNIGVTYAIQGSFGKARVWYKKALELDENYALAHYNLSTALYELGENAESLEHAEKAAELDPATHLHQASSLIKQINRKLS